MSKKILILDDEELIIRTVAKLLEKEGFEVMVAKNGGDAIVMAEEEGFDLMIVDIRMPGMNGLEAVKAIHQTQSIPVIFITGYADTKVEQEAKTMDPVAYIYKPFDNSVLMQKVKEVLDS